MTELVECNTQLHKTLQGLWSDALTQHKLQQHDVTAGTCTGQEDDQGHG